MDTSGNTKMSIEQKARAYDEAKERMRAFLKEWENCGAYGEAMEKARSVFPELTESEEERIRKEIINYILYKADGVSEEQGRSWIAYLEKQKEKEKYDRMMPVYDNLDSFESALAKAWKAYNDSGARTVDGCEDDYVECAHAKGFREGFLYGLEKQKECLADNSKTLASEDERIIDDAIQIIRASRLRCAEYGTEADNHLKAIAYLEKQKEPHYTKRNALFDKCVENCDPNVMREVSDEVDEMLEKEQKPVEWSEDFDEEVEKIHKRYPEVSFAKLARIAYHFSKWANRCKDIEWSEEDNLPKYYGD